VVAIEQRALKQLQVGPRSETKGVQESWDESSPPSNELASNLRGAVAHNQERPVPYHSAASLDSFKRMLGRRRLRQGTEWCTALWAFVGVHETV
jgi:hypothetical protein